MMVPSRSSHATGLEAKLRRESCMHHDADGAAGLQEHSLLGSAGLQSRPKPLSHRAVPHLNSPSKPFV